MPRLPPLITTLLILASLAIAGISQMGENRAALMPFFIALSRANGGFGLNEVMHGEVWRLVTPIFIHFGPMHLIFNLIWLYDLGGQIERRAGSVRFMGLTVVLALVSNLAQYYLAGPLFGGMSGVVYGYFGYVLVQVLAGRNAGYFLAKENMVIMIGWFFACWAGWLGPVANFGHTGGLTVGLLIGCIALALGRRRLGSQGLSL